VNGIERIAEAFAAARADGRRAALMPYLMGGFPSLETSALIGRAYAEAGAHLVELGVPFSDPLADGPVIHAAATAALRGGVRVSDVLEVGRSLAQHLPVVAMIYANPIFTRGSERFVSAVREAGISGLIVPDLPLEESGELRELCDAAGIALVPLVTPTTPEERLARIGAGARGFVYTVSLTGTTGERASQPDDGVLAGLLARVRGQSEVPVAVGFGIGAPEQAAAAAAAGADGVIIGSRLVRAAGEEADPVGAVGSLVRGFSAALVDPVPGRD
jgi:tryptophan synthase alpha chain